MSEGEPSSMSTIPVAAGSVSVNGASVSDSEFAERIIRRLKPRNLQEVFDKAASTSRSGGMLITLMVAVWWLGIYSQDDNMSEGISVFFGLNFGQVAFAVMVLSLLSAILTEFSRDMGKIFPSTAAGGMLILAGLYVVEPLVGSFFATGDLSTADGLWRTVRLGALWGGMSMGSNLLVNAMLLNWLIRFIDSNDYEFTGMADASPSSEAILDTTE
ncbi:MAG: hypothetical protein P8Q40_05675 [Candidatus Poseidonia sp.]|uniref:hypothetical protein n=1 Tax=Poseidonia sp. TaxID=2666344 RepID=UPI0030C2F41E|nr:hypothetical protein [Poseidonia sp.]